MNLHWRRLGIIARLFALVAPFGPGAAAQSGITKPVAELPASDAGAVMTFNEEFRSLRADALGASGWKTTFDRGDRTLPTNHEAQQYLDPQDARSPFSIVDGQLVITASPCPNPAPLPFCSGLLTSRTLFSQRYGYFEMRAKLPAGRGLWPAFWLLPAKGGWPPELDVLEMLGQSPTTIYASAHWQEGRHRSVTKKIAVPDTSAGFHRYGLSWHADVLRWYFDGREVAQMPTPPGLDQPMYLLVNLAVGGPGSWPGPADASTPLPGRYIVDTVRAYQSADRVGAPQ